MSFKKFMISTCGAVRSRFPMTPLMIRAKGTFSPMFSFHNKEALEEKG